MTFFSICLLQAQNIIGEISHTILFFIMLRPTEMYKLSSIYWKQSWTYKHLTRRIFTRMKLQFWKVIINAQNCYKTGIFITINIWSSRYWRTHEELMSFCKCSSICLKQKSTMSTISFQTMEITLRYILCAQYPRVSITGRDWEKQQSWNKTSMIWCSKKS